MIATAYTDFALDVIKDTRKWDWVALMVDVDPAQLRSCVCDFPARFYVPPADYLPEGRPLQQCLVSIPESTRMLMVPGRLSTI